MSLAARRLLAGIVGASLIIGLTAMPLSAAKPTKKYYRLDITPHEVANGTATTFDAKFTNTSPDGVSSFNSLTLTAPAGFSGFDVDDVSVTEPAGSGYSKAVQLVEGRLQIIVTGLPPIGANQWATVRVANVSVDLEPTSDCGDQKAYWGSEVWTGSNTGGNTFEPKQQTGDQNYTTVQEAGISVPAGGSISAGDGTVTATNIGTTCAQNVSLTREGDVVELLKPDGVTATWRIEVNAWDPEPADAPIPLARWTEVDTPGDFHDIEWCEGTPSAPILPGTEVSCLISQSSVIYGPDGDGSPGNPNWVGEYGDQTDYQGQLIQVSEVIYLAGDWGARR